MIPHRILCYGDSNTWGPDMVHGGRLGPNVRWTGVLQNGLGADFHVIEEGLGGRTTLRDDPYEPYRNGRAYLRPCLMSHDPLDLVVLMLGTNDLKNRFNVGARDISRGIEVLINDIKTYAPGAKTLLIAPVPLSPKIDPEDMFDKGIKRSRALANHYHAVSKTHDVGFFDAGSVIELQGGDGIHLSQADHQTLGTALVEPVKNQCIDAP